MIYSKTIESPIGSMLACSTDEGICLLEFVDSPNLEVALKDISKDINDPIVSQSCDIIDNLANQLTAYFERRLETFNVPLYLVGTDFQKKVWSSLLNIDFGKTITYKEQALALGDIKAIRAVASANGANKIPIIIPCHRVVGSNGSLTGYSGGIWRKKYLLDLENCQYKINL